MKALAVVLISVLLSAGVAIALALHGPAWAWWVNPVALAALAGTVPLLIALMLPRAWWRG